MVPYVGQNANFVALDFDADENFIYFSETRNDVIYRMHPDGTGTQLTDYNILSICAIKVEYRTCVFSQM